VSAITRNQTRKHQPELDTPARSRVNRTKATRLTNALRSLPSDPGVQLEEFMVEQQVPVDAVSASFTDAQLTNSDEVRAWWGHSSALTTMTLVPADLGDGTDPLDARVGRAKEAMAALGHGDRQRPVGPDPHGSVRDRRPHHPGVGASQLRRVTRPPRLAGRPASRGA
jgi:hypothetical protein